MFSIRKNSIDHGVHEYFLLVNDSPMSVSLWLENMIHSAGFRSLFNKVIQENPFIAFFWELPPVTEQNLDNDFRFVIVKSTALENISTDDSAFSEFFSRDEDVVSFMNLGKDARLIVPCPTDPSADYAHLGSFVRTAAENQIDIFWERAAVELKNAMGSSPRWLSTAGLGVSWLHLRIDSRPKYYRHSPYKNA